MLVKEYILVKGRKNWQLMQKYYKPRKNRYQMILSCLFLLIGLTGCNIPKTPQQPLTPTQDLSQLAATETAEIVPTSTPIPDPQKVLLVITADTNAGILDRIRSGIQSLPEGQAEITETTAFTEDQITEATDVVIFPKIVENLSEIAGRFPQTKFITIDRTDQNLPNVWTIRYDPAFETFLGGYAVALSAYDWRGAGLLPNDSLFLGGRTQEVFQNGAQYFCGTCVSSIAPFVAFPLAVMLPAAATPQEWVAGIDQIQSNYIYTYFVSEEAASDDVYQKMLSLDVSVIGVNDPPAGLESKWLAGIRIDLGGAVNQILLADPTALASGLVIPELDVRLGSIGGSFNEGKKTDMQKVYADLIFGMVFPYDPQPADAYTK